MLNGNNNIVSRFAFALLAFLFLCTNVKAGDTTTVRIHNATHLNWNGNFDAWGVLPDTSKTYEKILMNVTIGCPTTGCSDWDYSTTFYLREHTGNYDSNLVYVPNYAYGTNNSFDTICFALNPTYTYFFNTSTSSTDSTINTTEWFYYYNDPVDLYLATDSIQVYPANYYNYIYNSGAVIIDSVLVGSDSCKAMTYDSTYVPFEIIENYQLGKYITPYGGWLPNSWEQTWTYDVTDFTPLLHDSTEIRVNYDGWSDGFTATIDFVFIEGTPPRNVKRVEKLWNGYFNYGSTTDPIENHLPAITLPTYSNEFMGKIRLETTGHSFGGVQNCAEFCHKHHTILIDSNAYDQDLWDYDCGNNPLYPQAGTWLYNRAGWCPGKPVLTFEYDMTPHLIPGDSITVDYNMASYTYGGGAGFHPGYGIGSHAIFYSAPNFVNDAAIENVINPTNNWYYNRYNPTCFDQKITIKNTGSSNLTSLQIIYRTISGGNTINADTFQWTGNLAFLETEEVTLPSISLDSANTFEVAISNPNGTTDEYADNNTIVTNYATPPSLPSDIIIKLYTNFGANETSWKITDFDGNIIKERKNGMSPKSNYFDTLHLQKGCYQMFVHDTGEDGLEFFANNDGNGVLEIREYPSYQLIKEIEPNFGRELVFAFKVDSSTTVGKVQELSEELIEVYPNPSSGIVNLILGLKQKSDVKVKVLDLVGRTVFDQSYENIGMENLNLDLTNEKSGVYFVNITIGNQRIVKKIIIQK